MKKIILGLSLLLSFRAVAFSVIPMVVEFSDRGKGATQTFTASHERGDKVAVEVVATTRSLELSGKEKRVETEDLLIYPPQLILKAGESKKIRVTYVGKKFKGRQKSYRLIFRQLPVDLKKKKKREKASLKFLFEYVASAYVNGDLSVKGGLKLVKQKKNANGIWSLWIENNGGRYQLTKNWSLSYQDSKGKVHQLAFEMASGKPLPNILAGSKVKLSYPAKTARKWMIKKK